MLAIIKQYVRRMLMGKGKGILQIPPQKAVDDFANDLLKKFKKNGVPDEAITNPRDVKIIWEQITNREAAILSTNLKDVLKKSDPFKKAGEVVDLTGKKIDTSKPILGGKNVPETEAQIKTKLEGMNEKTVDRIRRRRYEAARKAEREKMAKDPDYLPKIIDPEDFAGGGRASSGLNYLLGEDDQNSRVPYGAGGMGRRLFLKLMGGAAAGTVAAKSGLFSLLKAGKPTAQVLTSVPINNIDGMPVWFKPLVNKVIKEGDDVTKKFATVDREIVHQSTLPDSKTPVTVTQDITSGNVSVDIGMGKHGFSDGLHGQPVRLEYRASEVIEPSFTKNKETIGKAGKTKEDFWVEEAEFTGGHPENIKFEESTIEKFGEHGSNFAEVEKFATGKINKKTAKESIKAERAHWTPEGDMASGGRVPLAAGLLAKLGINSTTRRFLEKIFGKEGFETMIKRDPEMHRGLLEVAEMFRKKDKPGLVKYMKQYLPHMDDAEIEDFIIGGHGTEGVHGQLIRLGSGRDYKGKMEMIKKLEKNNRLRDFDVTGRKPNASGGLAGMLGE